MEENEKLLIETVQRAKSNQRRIEELESRVEEHHALGVPVKLESVEEKVNRLERSVSEIHTLSLSVSKLANNMEQMLEEQREQRKDIDVLKNEPSERWNSMKRTAFTAVISTISGALAVGLVTLLANFVK
ncbi:MAG: hypothetical protein ACOX6U_04890 [Oscillospiraceae bacterium]